MKELREQVRRELVSRGTALNAFASGCHHPWSLSHVVEGQFRSDVARLPIRRSKEHYQQRLHHEILLHPYWNQIL